MSWTDKINNPLIITTGDGKVYKPLWMNPTHSEAFNTVQFAFPHIKGELLDRREVLGRKLPLEFFFTGDDHLDEAEAFRISSHNKNFWKIDHPFYGKLNVHPSEIIYDNTGLNVTKITTTVIETIIDDHPKSTVDPIDQVKILKEINDEELAISLTEIPGSKDINTMTSTNTATFAKGVPIIKLPEEFETYYNLFKTASTLINTATASPLLAMRAVMAVLSYPAQFTVDAQTRIQLLTDQFNIIRNTVTKLFSVSSKQIYQNQGAVLISSMCLAAATPLPTDYKNTTNVIQTIEDILDNYNAYLEDLDFLQGPNGGNPVNFMPNADPLIGLNILLVNTLGGLYDIALNARTERFIITEKDTNIILLTHRLYGLDESDDNINELFQNNDWGLNHIFEIKKNTKVKYYI